MSEWQPIETAPRDGTAFVGCNLKDSFVIIARYKNGAFGDGELFPHIPLTHWFPLPSPPEPKP